VLTVHAKQTPCSTCDKMGCYYDVGGTYRDVSTASSNETNQDGQWCKAVEHRISHR